jgi:hypothetical protein
MDANKMIKVLLLTNLLTLACAGAASYFAYQAMVSADDAYAEAESANSHASNAEDMLNARR